jgi:hypothetical protein
MKKKRIRRVYLFMAFKFMEDFLTFRFCCESSTKKPVPPFLMPSMSRHSSLTSICNESRTPLLLI